MTSKRSKIFLIEMGTPGCHQLCWLSLPEIIFLVTQSISCFCASCKESALPLISLRIFCILICFQPPLNYSHTIAIILSRSGTHVV